MTEITEKLRAVRQAMADADLAAVRLRGVDWFAWATAGGSSGVLLSAEQGVAEVLVTPDRVFVLTNAIEAQRLRDEEVPATFEVVAEPWREPDQRERFVRDLIRDGAVASDHPRPEERTLPLSLVLEKWRIHGDAEERYRRLGLHASQAMTRSLQQARPEWSEQQLASVGAQALWEQGVQPDLILVAGSERLPRHRHPLPTKAALGERAMMVFCARRHGLYANITRFVSFREPTASERAALTTVAIIEERAWQASRPDTPLQRVFQVMASAYQELGHGGEINHHHQGGVTGYRPREYIVTDKSEYLIREGMVLAWNPSLPGMKIEDTVLVEKNGVEVLTRDPSWPTFTQGAHARPDFLVRP